MQYDVKYRTPLMDSLNSYGVINNMLIFVPSIMSHIDRVRGQNEKVKVNVSKDGGLEGKIFILH